MIDTMSKVGSCMVLAGLLLGASSRVEAAVCATKSGKLSVRDICRVSERTMSAGALGLGTDGASTPPKAFSGYHDHFVSLPFTEKAVFVLPVPEVGSYLITAKVKTLDTALDNRVRCRLYANEYRDEAVSSVDGEEQTLAFSFVDSFSSPGKLTLACWSDRVGAHISWIKINAVEVSVGSNSWIPQYVAPVY